MIAIEFEQANVRLAESQDEYETLPIHVPLDENGQLTDIECPCTCCFQLNKEEIDELVKTGKLYFTQLTFGSSFQPIRMSTTNPFINQEPQ